MQQETNKNINNQKVEQEGTFNSCVYGKATVYENAMVYGKAEIYTIGSEEDEKKENHTSGIKIKNGNFNVFNTISLILYTSIAIVLNKYPKFIQEIISKQTADILALFIILSAFLILLILIKTDK